tara:strand:- start:748 stop:1254 length:507 start_codon:yes stop_codon:yes gene_type:complete
VFLRVLCALFALIGLVACSPEYNWREVAISGAGVSAIFPDKPKVDEKRFIFEGETLVLSMTGTTVKSAIFAIGHAPLGARLQENAVARQALYRQVVSSFYSNFNQATPNPLPAPGELFVVTGKGPNGDMQLSARVWMTSDYLLEAIVVAPQALFPEEHATEFFAGVAF